MIGLLKKPLGPFVRGKIRRVLFKTRLIFPRTIYTSMSYLIRRVLTKPRLILGEMCHLYGKFTSYLRRVLCIFPRINGPIVDLPIRLKGNSKHASRNSLSPFGSHNKDLGAASLMLLIGVRFCLRYRIRKTQRKFSFRIGIFPLKNFSIWFVFPKVM